MSRLRWPDSTHSVSEKPGTIHGHESAVNEVHRATALTGVGRGDPGPAPDGPGKAHRAHQARHGAARHADAVPSQLLPDFPGAVDLLVRVIDPLNLDAELTVALRPCGPARRMCPSAGADGDESVDGAIGSTAQIGSTPTTARWSAMNWTIVATSSGGRAPPGRNTRTLSAGSHSPASVHGPRAPAPSTAPARSSSGPADAQHHAAPAAPTSAASPPCSRASAPPTAAPPTLRRGPPGTPRPSGRHVRALPEKTDWDVP